MVIKHIQYTHQHCTMFSHCSDLSVELPFTLTHPKPVETPPPSRPPSTLPQGTLIGEIPVDTNLIQLDTEYVVIHFLQSLDFLQQRRE